MSTNANVFNSRVTSEALEAKFRQVFPAQAGAELIQDLYASGVIQPVIDFSSVAEGSFLAPNLQTAWDFSTGHVLASGGSGTTTVINNTGFWKLNVSSTIDYSANNQGVEIAITDGSTSKTIWRTRENLAAYNELFTNVAQDLVAFLRTGDSLTVTVAPNTDATVSYRQIADVNGNLVNPLGFTFS